MILSIGISIIIFPKTAISAFNMLGILKASSSDAASTISVAGGQTPYMPLLFQFKLAIIYINREVFGLDIISPFRTMFIPYFICILLLLAIIISGICFIFRNDLWFIKIKDKILSKIKSIIFNLRYNVNFVILAMLLAIVCICLSAAYIADLYNLDSYGDRYLMICYPVFFILVCIFFYKIIKIFTFKKPHITIIILAIFLVSITIKSNMRECQYFSKDKGSIELEDISQDSDFVILSSRNWLLVQYSAKLLNCNNFFFCNYNDLANQINNINSHRFSDNTYIIIDTSILDDTESASYSISPDGNSSYIAGTDFIKNAQLQNKTTAPSVTLAETLNICSNISCVKSLNYIGDDYINGFHLKVYKVN